MRIESEIIRVLCDPDCGGEGDGEGEESPVADIDASGLVVREIPNGAGIFDDSRMDVDCDKPESIALGWAFSLALVSAGEVVVGTLSTSDEAVLSDIEVCTIVDAAPDCG